MWGDGGIGTPDVPTQRDRHNVAELRARLVALVDRHRLEAANYRDADESVRSGRDYLAGFRAGVRSAFRTWGEDITNILEETL
jgi:hypothetical protein